MWQGFQATTDYKPAHTIPPSSDASLPELNHFYGRFDRDNKEVAIQADFPVHHQPLSLCPANVFAALSRTNALIVSPDVSSGPVLCSRLRPVLTYSTSNQHK